MQRKWDQRQRLEAKHPELAGDTRPVAAHEGRYEQDPAPGRRPGDRVPEARRHPRGPAPARTPATVTGTATGTATGASS